MRLLSQTLSPLPLPLHILLLLITASLASAQIPFFENFFQGGGGGGGGGHQHQQQQQQREQNVASDSEWYQRTSDGGMYAYIYILTTYSAGLLGAKTNTCWQHTAPITFVLVHCPAWLFRITALAPGLPLRIKSNWVRVVRCVLVKAGGRRARCRGKWNWLGWGNYKNLFLLERVLGGALRGRRCFLVGRKLFPRTPIVYYLSTLVAF